MCAITTLLFVVVFALRASGMWRLWVPIIGIVVGCIVASFFGLYDIQRVIDAPWIGFPAGGGWPGFDLSFGPVFWSLLPAFIFVTMVGAIETIGDSNRYPEGFRGVRPARPIFARCKVLSPQMAWAICFLVLPEPFQIRPIRQAFHSLSSPALPRAAWGVCIGIVFVVASFFPKVAALLLAIPNPVVGAYVIVLLALLFVVGMRIIVQDGVDYRKALISGTAFWIGCGVPGSGYFRGTISASGGGHCSAMG